LPFHPNGILLQGNLFWKIVGGALRVPSQEQVNCQQPKPVLIDTGEMFTPYAWAVGIVTHSWNVGMWKVCKISFALVPLSLHATVMFCYFH
jgi:hypothetical protein